MTLDKDLIKEVERIISPVYMVGGSVRDELLRRNPKDYDFITPLLPDEIEFAIIKSGLKPYRIGKKFGTLGVKLNEKLLEISTFKIEAYKKGRRKPEIEFVKDITEDLGKRDFTINAIAKGKNRYVDPFNGKEDLVNKKIRCVGKPEDRFIEDPLRMLRAARFYSELEFDIEYAVKEAVGKMCHKILEVSKERWAVELDKLLITDKPSLGLDFMAQTKLLNFMIPELSLQVNYNQDNPYHTLSLWNHTKKVVDLSPKEAEIRWAALLHDIAKPFVMTEKKGRKTYIKHDLLGKEMVVRLGTYLKWSKNKCETVSGLVFNHLHDSSPLKKADLAAK